MVKSYLFPLTEEEAENVSDYGWVFIDSHRDRLVQIDLDISSIDFGLPEAARFVSNDVVYSVYNSYCECVGMNTNRILLGAPITLEKENPKPKESEVEAEEKTEETEQT